MESPIIPKIALKKSAEEALSALSERCAHTEICCDDVRRLLTRWEVPATTWPQILERLLHERFVDHHRYAGAFVRDKANFSSWGTHKIRQALQLKHIEPEIITEALEQLDPEAMTDKIQRLLIQKARTVKARNNRDFRDKLIRFGLSKGYNFDQIFPTVEELVRTTFSADDNDTF